MQFSLIRFLSGLTLTSVLTAVSVAIRAPFLLSMGAESLSPADTSFNGLMAAGFFAALVLIVAVVAFKIAERVWRAWLIIFLVVCTIAAALNIASWLSGSAAIGFIAACSLWLAVALACGATLRLLPEGDQPATFSSITGMILRCLPAASAGVVAACVYSLGILPHMPRALGGMKLQVVIFPDVKVPADLPMESSTMTSPVELLFATGTDFWLRYPDVLTDGFAVRPHARSEIGQPLAVGISPDEYNSARRRQWLVPYRRT